MAVKLTAEPELFLTKKTDSVGIYLPETKVGEPSITVQGDGIVKIASWGADTGWVEVEVDLIEKWRKQAKKNKKAMANGLKQSTFAYIGDS